MWNICLQENAVIITKIFLSVKILKPVKAAGCDEIHAFG